MNANPRVRGTLIATVLVLVTVLACCFAAVSAYADAPTELKVEYTVGDWDSTGTASFNGSKVYDGTTDVTDAVTAKISALTPVAAGDDVTVNVTAVYDSANVADASSIRLTFTLVGADAADYVLNMTTVALPATITPKELTWKTVDGKECDEIVAVYPAEIGDLTAPVGYELDGLIGTDTATVTALSVKEAADTALTVGNRVLQYGATLDNPNYIAVDLTAPVKVVPATLTSIEWSGGNSFVYSANPLAATSLTAVGKDSLGNSYPLSVGVMKNGTLIPLAAAFTDGIYGKVLRGDDETVWTITAICPEGSGAEIPEGLDNQYAVTIERLREDHTVTPSVSDRTLVFANEDELKAALSAAHPLIVSFAEEVPDGILQSAIYAYSQGGKTVKRSEIGFGLFSVSVQLHEYVVPNTDCENLEIHYGFDRDGAYATTLTLTAGLTIQNASVAYLGEANAVVVSKDGGTGGMLPDDTTVATVGNLDSDEMRKFPIYTAYRFRFANTTDGSTYTVVLPITSALIENERCEALTEDDLYVYRDGKLTPAKDAFTVTLTKASDGTPAYYTVSGIGGGEVILVTAPVYDAGFWVTPLGIALIVLIVILALILLALIGWWLVKIRNREKNKPQTIDTEGKIPAAEPKEEKPTIDVDKVLEKTADDYAAALEKTTEAEKEPESEVAPEETAEAVAEAMDDLISEVKESVEEPTEEPVEEPIEEPQETAEEAIPVVAPVEEETDEEEDEEEEESEEPEMGGFGGAPDDSQLKYIDVKKFPEEYAEMQAQEARGEAILYTKYRYSFQAKLAQSQGSVQDYYDALKNLLLSYKTVKSRTSWNYDAFNSGRHQVAKMIAKNKTLNVYLSIDPATLEGTKYGVKDVSAKKKYEAIPSLMKIRGDRKFAYTRELIIKICEEDLALAKNPKATERDYKTPYLSLDEMVEAGIVRKLVAAGPVPTEEPTAEAPDTAKEAPDVTQVVDQDDK